MNNRLKRAPIAVLLLAAWFGGQSSQAQTIQATQLTLVSPAACPPAGCAAGQTIDLKASFSLDTTLNPNVLVCLNTPVDWMVAGSFKIDALAAKTGATYQLDSAYCTTSPDYATLGLVSTNIPAEAVNEELTLRFRIAPMAATSGLPEIRIFQQSSAGWVPSGQSNVAIGVTPTAAAVYVANDAAACGSSSPCYLNSGADSVGGMGTALKDAVDAQPATVTILGEYAVKSHTVWVDRAVAIQGSADSRITYAGASCSEPMLRLTAGVTLRSLTITDGANCSAPSRDLVEVDSPADVTLEYVDLLSGQNGLKVSDNTGNVTLRFSQIMDNSEYALFRVPYAVGGAVQAVGNNLYNNRPGIQVDCGNAGQADHNFWGFGVAATTATGQCTVSDNKRLGAPAQPRSGDAGVQGETVTVTTTKQSGFNGLVGYQRSTDGSDYKLNLINHGAGSPEDVPFTGGALGSLTACSNYYDIFLEKDAVASAQLTLSLRYHQFLAGCASTIETAEYCASGDAAKIPLYWFSPSGTVPGVWQTTGSTGQATTCNTAAKEIQVVIDSSDRPDFSNDLNFTPFVVGLLPQPSSVVITRFVAIPGSAQAAIQWTTASEVNLSGFYVLRSLAAAGPFARVSNLIVHTGSSTGGANYEYIDVGLTNNTYYYRLEIVNNSLGSTFSNVISATIGQPTPTFTLTFTPTHTQTVTGTITPTGPTPTPTGSLTRTPTRTITLTRFPTRTRTPIRYATYYVFRSPTPAPTRTPFPTRTITPTPTLFPGARTSTAQAVNTLLPQPPITLTVTLTPASIDQATGYPAAGGTAISSLGTPETVDETSQAATDAVTPATGVVAPGVLPGKQAPAVMTFGKRYWPWILGLLGLELVTVGGVAIYLNKRGLLTIPPVARDGRDPED
ncbi:MAG: right-handed parallel beta-helix repeat-containing protein [Bellilinea sp.]